MNLLTIIEGLKKFERDAKHRFFIVTGRNQLGKTTAALSRAVFLQDNYCIRDDESILVVSREDLRGVLKRAESDSGRINTLFSFINSNPIQVSSLKKLIDECFHELQESLKLDLRLCDNDVAKGIILEGINTLRATVKRLDKLIICKNIDFLFDEIMYIKEMNINSLKEYQELNRKKRGRTIRKNSKAREHIYSLYTWYCKCMLESNLIDEVDEFKLVFHNSEYIKTNHYAHIIVDNAEELTVKEVGFIRKLLKNEDYSNFILVRNSHVEIDKPWVEHFTKNKSTANFDQMKYKVINCDTLLKKLNMTKVKDIEEDTRGKVVMVEEKKDNKFIELYKYIDFKHNVSHDFAIDTSSYDEVILNPDTTSEIIGNKEINKVPVYNEIAAGQPISINDEIEGEFNIPIYWLKGVAQPFILRIKGDSMININIEDGDYVVINKQTMANHNEIVAVSIDGEATLKRLWLRGNKAVLMPENDKYSPIEITEDNAYIIGKAVGLIKAVN